MDTRYSDEQLALRSATAALLADLGPRTVADLDDTARRARLAKAADSAGWFDLRGPGEDDGPLATGVEVAIVARELGRARGRCSVPRSGRRRRSRPPGGPRPGRPGGEHRARRRVARRRGPGTVGRSGRRRGRLRGLGARAPRRRGRTRRHGVGGRRPAPTARARHRPDPRRRPVAPRRRRARRARGTRRRRRHADADAGAGVGDHGRRPGRHHGGHVGDDAHLCAGARAVRRRHRVIPGGAAPPGGGAGAGRGRDQRGAVRGVGGRRVWRPRTRRTRARWQRRTARGRRARCARPRSRSTVGSATPGSASCTCTCAERCCRARCWGTRAITSGGWPAVDWGTTVDFDDSPEEAAFRARIRAWLAEHNPGLPASSTDDEYWARQAEWHCALFDAGFFALTWPKRSTAARSCRRCTR